MVIRVWRLEMGEIEMTDNIVLIFEMALQLTISRESFNIKYSRECRGHSDRFENEDRGE
jgi:hypothetical protein